MIPTPGAKHLTIEDKDLTRHSAILRKPRKTRVCFVFAHGAGISHIVMEQIAVGLYARGIATLRYQFPLWRKAAGGRIRPPSLAPLSRRPSSKPASDVAACRWSPAASPSAGG